MSEIALKPTYWASVSGGKDSLYMLKLILENLDKYPLDGVVHFELEIDFPFIKDVVNYMEQECKKIGVRFVRIKPRKTFSELYAKYGFPSRTFSWCNSKYKLDAQKQLVEFMKSLGYNTIFYIGYCKDEVARYSKRVKLNERYPLVENNIIEDQILDWAKEVPIFNDYYRYTKRCGCMYCPLASYLTMAYVLKYYPKQYEEMIQMMRETEQTVTEKYKHKGYSKPFTIKGGTATADYVDWIVRTKWLKILNRNKGKPKKLI